MNSASDQTSLRAPKALKDEHLPHLGLVEVTVKSMEQISEDFCPNHVQESKNTPSVPFS